MMCVGINVGTAGVRLWWGVGRAPASPLAQLGVTCWKELLHSSLPVLHLSAPSLLFIFQLIPHCRNGCKRDCSARVKILYTCNRVLRLRRALCCCTVTDTCKSLCGPWK